MNLCRHGQDLEQVRCLLCRLEAIDNRLTAEAGLRGVTPPARRCWKCAADALIVEAVRGDIYCESHRDQVERESEVPCERE